MLSEFMNMVLAKAIRHPPSRVIKKRRDARLGLLTKICRVLDEEFHGNPFYLSTPDVAYLCGVSVGTAWRDLETLRKEGVITKVKAGTRGEGGEANQWKYNGQ